MPIASTARAARPQLTPEDLSLSNRARDIWRTLRDDAGLMARLTAEPKVKWIVYRLHREDDRSDPLEQLAKIVVQFASLGVPEAFFRRMHGFLGEIIDECFAGKSSVSRADLDRQEFALEQCENALGFERVIDGTATADELDAEAVAIEAEVAVEIVRARHLRREARQLRAGLVTA